MIDHGQMFPMVVPGRAHSAKDGSPYERVAFLLKKWLRLLHYWVPVTTAALDAEMNKGSAIAIYQWFREVCSTTLLTTPIILGKIVEIDESLFRHKF